MALSSNIDIRDQGAMDLIRSLLQQGLRVRIRVTGKSMRPLLSGGEIVEVVPCAKENPALGDLVLYCVTPRNPVIHRVIRHRYDKGGLYLQTKGDACAAADDFIPVNQVFGRIERIIAVDEGLSGKVVSVKHLRTPAMRLKARLTVIRWFIRDNLRRLSIFLKMKV